jgi:isoquinoline 1-oxidoreductase beta subunit
MIAAYPALRMSRMPQIDFQLMPTDNPAKGIGEASLPMVAPCAGNALFKLTGKRFRALPPERVKAVTGV